MKNKAINKFRFIDLFCGIGGFHQALVNNGGECVFACDIDENCRSVYSRNFCKHKEFPVESDVNLSIQNHSIPPFDFLCAGFPCQTFSKAGNRNGFTITKKSNGEKDERGQLFFRIIDILREHPECKYILLENVRNLADNKDNWQIICNELKQLNFIISEEPIIESPHRFGIPQIRERVYILGIKKEHFDRRRSLPLGYITRETIHLSQYIKYNDVNSCIPQILEKDTPEKYWISDELNDLLEAWEELRTNTKNLSHPFWLQYAGIGIHDNEAFMTDKGISFYDMPEWKQHIVSRIREYYITNMSYIDNWVIRHRMLERILIHQKFEWNAGDNYTIKDCILQIRQSGVRVKRPNFFPSLVAMNNTSVIWDPYASHFRFLSPKECAKLQSFKEDYIFSNNDSVSYRQLGNSVNVRILEILSLELLKLGKKI